MESQAAWLLGRTGHEIAGCCMQTATRDYALFGLFVLANGDPGRGYDFQWWTYDDGSEAAQGIYGHGIHIDPQRRLAIASSPNWTRASIGPESQAREAFNAEVRALVDAGG